MRSHASAWERESIQAIARDSPFGQSVSDLFSDRLLEERDQFAQQLGDLDQKLRAAELRRAEAEREAEVLSRQLDTFARRLAEGATKPKKVQSRKSTRSR
ncbi:MAG: hypothetical protein HKM94_08460 [Halobacteria archaeon]|nr:hypothetical protein [Halobacteria archaeon]